jgi:beta-lactam-binding protein with PASTA domain
MKSSRYNENNIFIKFWRKHIILSNVILIFLSIFVLGGLAMGFINLWTHHGATTIVPNVRNMSYDKACSVLEDADLTPVISDSVYDEKKMPGEVLDISPKAGVVVKPGREVFLTIVSFSPKQIVIDVPLTDVSSRQAISYLQARGIKTIKIIHVPSQYPDLVVSVKYNGKPLNIGSKVPVNSVITLEVGQTPQPEAQNAQDDLSAAIDAVIDAENAEAQPEASEPDTEDQF